MLDCYPSLILHLSLYKLAILTTSWGLVYKFCFLSWHYFVQDELDQNKLCTGGQYHTLPHVLISQLRISKIHLITSTIETDKQVSWQMVVLVYLNFFRIIED